MDVQLVQEGFNEMPDISQKFCKLLYKYLYKVLAHHSAGLVVVKVHQVSQLPSFLQILFVRSIDKSLREIDSIPQVVAVVEQNIIKS